MVADAPQAPLPRRRPRGVLAGPVFALALLCASLVVSPADGSGSAGEIRNELPAAVDVGASYVFYLHGAIVEGTDRRPTSARFGVYEYDAILKALAAPERVVVSAQRPRGASPERWSERRAADVEQLIGAGVPSSSIAVIGFSKGGAIAILTSSRVDDSGVRYVLMGACGDWLSGVPELQLHGRVLSLIETSDNIGHSCRPLCERSPKASCREETLHTGLRHGAFYRPLAAWLTPTRAWIEGDR